MIINVCKIAKINILLIILPIIICVSCTEEYWPDLKGEYEDLLVIEGKITNEPGPYTVKLSSSSSVQEPAYFPKSGAKVIITDNEGNAETLTEVESGVYKTSATGIQGKAGKYYKLIIETDGRKYETPFEKLKTAVGIEPIIIKHEIRQSDNPEDDEEGIRFYVSTDNAIIDTSYFYWGVEETYEFHAAYLMRFIFNGVFIKPIPSYWEYINVPPPPSENRYGVPVAQDPDSLFYCWKTNMVKERFTHTTENLSTPKLNNQPLHFIPYMDERIKIKYSLLVKQYTISEKAFLYQRKLKEQNSENDNLYTKQPFQIRSNLVNVDDPDEIILGYFMTAGVCTAERIFTKAPAGIEYDVFCGQIANDCSNKPEIYPYLIESNPGQWPLYMAYAWFMTGGSLFYDLVVVEKDCVDCTLSGGELNKPDFWED